MLYSTIIKKQKLNSTQLEESIFIMICLKTLVGCIILKIYWQFLIEENAPFALYAVE